MFNKKLKEKVTRLTKDVEELEREVVSLKSKVMDLRMENRYRVGSWFKGTPTITVKEAIKVILDYMGKDIVENNEKMPDKFKMVLKVQTKEKV